MAFRRWTWVEDTTTGHRFDVDHRQVDRLVKEGSVRVVEGYPPNEGQNVRPRQPKHAVDLAGDQRADGTPTGTPEAFDTAPTGTPAPASASPRRGSTRTATAAPTATTEGADL